MKLNRLVNLSALAVLAGTLTGCILAVGNSDRLRSPAILGQELTDLKKARDANVISEEEYQAQRKRLLGNPERKQN